MLGLGDVEELVELLGEKLAEGLKLALGLLDWLALGERLALGLRDWLALGERLALGLTQGITPYM